MNSRALITLAAMIACSAAQSAFAQTIIDTSQTVIDSANGTTLAIGGSSQQKLAQTVTADHGGELRALYLPISCGSGYLTIEIHDVDAAGKPGPSVLAWRLFTRVTASVIGPTYTRFKIGGIYFNPGDRYSIVIGNSGGSCGMYKGPVGNTYNGGNSFFDARPNAPGWVAFSGFANSPHDLPFLPEVFLP